MSRDNTSFLPQAGVSFEGGVTPDPSVVIRPRKGLFDLDLRALWHYRELFYFLVWRDVKVRYKQTIIGAGWAVFQPLMTGDLHSGI